MKKKYSKPIVIVEDFSLQTSIAAGCQFKTDTQVEGACGYPTRNGIIFTDEIVGCEYKRPDQFDSICYHVPTDTSDLFNS